MITFLWPWAFAALPVPLLVRRLAKPADPTPDAALRVPFFATLHAGDSAPRPNRGWLRLAMAGLIWALMLAALARPVVLGPPSALPVEGRDIMMAIDLSGSMARADFALNGQAANRLEVVRQAADDFIARRAGDRIGLVLFSDRAYLQAPLTLDRKVVRQLLDQAEVGLTGTETAIGDAIVVAAKRLADRPAGQRVLILMTDGANNSGAIEPLRAAELAKTMGVRIYTIGLGARQMMVDNGFGAQMVNPSQDLDEDTLTRIADATGGKYFRATDADGLSKIYHDIDQIEPVADPGLMLRPMTSLLHWPLGAAVLLSMALALSMLPWPRLALRRAKVVTQ